MLLDGKRVLSCLTLAAQCEGREVTTIEGLAPDGRLHPVQEAFIRHDGFQCGYCTPGQIISAVALLQEGRAGSDVWPEQEELREQLAHIAAGLAAATRDLQRISRGIHPAILSEGGLGPALKTLARRSAIPVELSVRTDRRLPQPAEVAAYYVVSEALTNAAKHARASRVRVDVTARDALVVLSIRDDGVGGADAGRGSGLIGLRDRVEAVGGELEIASPAGSGTFLHVEIPIEPS